MVSTNDAREPPMRDSEDSNSRSMTQKEDYLLTDAIWDEDSERARQILDAHPHLATARLKHHGYSKTPQCHVEWAGEWDFRPPTSSSSLVLTLILPGYKEVDRDKRQLSPACLAIAQALVDGGAVLEDTLKEWVVLWIGFNYDALETPGPR